MKLYHRSKYYLLKAVLRALLFKYLNLKKFKFSNLVIIGNKSGFYSKNNGKIQVGKKSFFFDNVEVQSRGLLKIGNNVHVNNYSRIVAFDKIIIGNNVTIAQFVSIIDHNHKFELINDKLELDGYTTSPITIGNNVWISDKVTILRGVTIGNNVIIGANSLVNKDIQSDSIVGGVPAKLLKSITIKKNE